MGSTVFSFIKKKKKSNFAGVLLAIEHKFTEIFTQSITVFSLSSQGIHQTTRGLQDKLKSLKTKKLDSLLLKPLCSLSLKLSNKNKTSTCLLFIVCLFLQNHKVTTNDPKRHHKGQESQYLLWWSSFCSGNFLPDREDRWSVWEHWESLTQHSYQNQKVSNWDP